MEGHLLLTIVFMCTCSSSLIYAITNDVTTASVSSANENEAQNGDSSLVIEHVSSTVNSITIRWNSTRKTSESGRSSDVRIEALNEVTLMTIISPNLSTTDDFTIPDLAVDTKYLVCVVRIDDQVKTCDVIRTIPNVRWDTLLAVLLTLAFIALLILTAFICWRCALYHASPPTDDQPEACNDDNGKVCNASPTADEQPLNDEKSPLLAPKTATLASNNEQQMPTTLYLFLAGPALEGNDSLKI